MELILAKGTPAELREFVRDNPLFEGARPLVEADIPNGSIDSQIAKTELSRVTARALKAVKVICTNAPRVKFERVAEEIGVSNNQMLGGVMSSLGHSAQTIKNAIDRDWTRGEYVVDPENARVILDAIGGVEI